MNELSNVSRDNASLSATGFQPEKSLTSTS